MYSYITIQVIQLHNNIHLTTTLIFSRAIFIMFPALFIASQVYNVVPGALVEAKWNGDDCRGIKVLFSYHCIVGIGNPSAMQYNNNVSPTFTVCDDCKGSIVILGASAYV